jgi:glyoxylase-like metal-dependent hydrolase (beta-lactamase superfamily II)
LTFVEPDRTLISGDVVQNQTMPNIFGDGGTPASWLAVLDKAAALKASHILPDHSAPGDGSLVAAEISLISEIRTRSLSSVKEYRPTTPGTSQRRPENRAPRLAQHQRLWIREKRLRRTPLENVCFWATDAWRSDRPSSGDCCCGPSGLL